MTSNTSDLKDLVDRALTAHTSTNLLLFLVDIEKHVGEDCLVNQIHPNKDRTETKRSTVILSLLKRIYFRQVMDSCSKFQEFGVTTRTAIDADQSFGKELTNSFHRHPDDDLKGKLRQFLLLQEDHAVSEEEEGGGGGDEDHVKTSILVQIGYHGSVQEAYGYELKPTGVHQNFIDKVPEMDVSEISAVYWKIKNELKNSFERDYGLYDIHLPEFRYILAKTQLFFAGACVDADKYAMAYAKRTHELFCRFDDEELNNQLYRLTIVRTICRHPRRVLLVGHYADLLARTVFKAEHLIFCKYNNCIIFRPRCSEFKKELKKRKNYTTVWMSQRDESKSVMAYLKHLADPEMWSTHQRLAGIDVFQVLCTVAMKCRRDNDHPELYDLQKTVLLRVIRVADIDE